jgi:uncharacterized protein YkwD
MRSETALHQSARTIVHVPPAVRALRMQQADLFAVRCFLILLLLFAVISTLYVTVHAQPQQPGAAERALFDATNRERVAHGLQPLQWDDSLSAAARSHAARMAQSNTLSHQLPGEASLQDRTRLVGARYSVIAENVAEGATADTIHAGWMNSPHHRANILDPDLTAIGIAVVFAPNASGGRGPGMLFAVQDFSQSVANLNMQQQENQVSSILAARGLQVTSGSGDARKTCVSDGNTWAGPRPGLMIKYETPDVNQLPGQIDQKIQSGKFRAAAVGACPATQSGSFTHFRIAILLY